MKHRKLFPAPPNPSNGTDNCFEFCVPFDDQGFNYAQPPPPSPPSPLAVPDQADQSHGVSPSVIVLVTLLASFSLLLGYYVVVTKSCFGLCKRRNNVEVDYSQSDGEGHEEFAEENHHAVDHPIWFITTAGLQQTIINSITVVKYRRNEGLIEGTECSVCLNEFREDETLRLLPKCSHAFHIPCIDTWLRSHTNCPLCRAHIMSNVNDNHNHNHRTGSTNTNSDNSVNRNGGDDHEADIVEETQMENSGSGGTFQRVDLDANICSNENCASERRNAVNGEMVKSDTVRARLVRSVSMDSSISSSSSSSSVANKVREVGQKESLRISPVAMKRSRSCGGRLKQRLNLVSLPL